MNAASLLLVAVGVFLMGAGPTTWAVSRTGITRPDDRLAVFVGGAVSSLGASMAALGVIL